MKNKTTDAAVHGLQEKKARDIVILDLREMSHAVCDYFIICHGDSTTQVEALADAVETEVREQLGEKPWHREGMENAQWILVDYVDVVVHVFHREAREFYDLEGLWADAPAKQVEYEV